MVEMSVSITPVELLLLNSFMTELPIILKPDLLCKSVDLFLYDSDLCHERDKG